MVDEEEDEVALDESGTDTETETDGTPGRVSEGCVLVSKGELLGKDAANSAVRMALAESHLITETKKYLADNGVQVAVFDGRLGLSLSLSPSLSLSLRSIHIVRICLYVQSESAAEQFGDNCKESALSVH